MKSYNSDGVQTPMPLTAETATLAMQEDRIDRLTVSDKWKKRFKVITKAVGPRLPDFRSLPIAERRGINFNWLAFLLGPFYFLAKGLWRQAIVYVLLAIALATLLELVGLGRSGRAVGCGFAAIYAVRANVSYYANVVQGQAPWV
ncbi:hypothetical protein A11M_0103375 [Xanthomonas vasicola pv. vasculorum NCPPB 895]|uniref:DUF2628 domain-containing protein n=1 Tax=Xanthomonas vasicola TaxID=56459 RepID=UPI0004D479A4|nr:DUF2628 domain-containing protein [Xanthomonas vasicola]KEZ98976.1 hypothetical protein A11M_0103375 [Xanthomonas vasicola pv. vasculorum NCPPB 895]MBV7305492.1 DUF2628 domain-containing protein [Xanthomonas vasicola pv. vasculorum]MDO6934786.1 DUF2628 domain-containing protein [Xanthomonas vasicola]MDO6938552.1 DUF2628 domain-containing protein [Xanthomonas vasicola]